MKLPRRLGLLGMMALAASLVGQEPAQKTPDAKAIAKARGLVHEIFAQDLKAATTPPARLKLVTVFMQQARENRDDAANRFVLLEEALDQASLAGDIHLALNILDELSRDFETDSLERRSRLLARAAGANPSVETARVLVDLILPLIREAVEADQYPAALELGKIASLAAEKADDAALVSQVKRRLNDVAAVQAGYSRLQAAIDRLKVDPKDPQANLDLGVYYAFLKQRWDKALPLLAMGGDATLKALATRDLAKPALAAEQLALADAWWERSIDEKEPGQLALQTRAAFWYEQAVARLAGINRTKAAKRIERVAILRSGLTGDGPGGPLGELKKLDGHADEVKSVAFSSDGRHALTGSVDQTARLWDLSTGKEEKVLKGHTKQLWAVAFHPNNRQAFTSSWDGTVRFWDLRTGDEVRRFIHRLDINGIALSRNADLLVAGSDDHNAYLWNTTTGEEIRRVSGHTGFVYGVALAGDGKHLATCGVDKSIRIHDVANGSLLRILDGHANPVTNVVFSPDSRYLFSCGDGQPRMWETATGQLVRRFEGHTGFALSLALSADGRRLVTGGDDRAIRLWDVNTGKELQKLTGHEGSVVALAISPDGRKALSGSIDRSVRLWGLAK